MNRILAGFLALVSVAVIVLVLRTYPEFAYPLWAALILGALAIIGGVTLGALFVAIRHRSKRRT